MNNELKAKNVGLILVGGGGEAIFCRPIITKTSPDSYITSWGHSRPARICGKWPIWVIILRRFITDNQPLSYNKFSLQWSSVELCLDHCPAHSSTHHHGNGLPNFHCNVFTYSCHDLTGKRKHFPHSSNNFYSFIPVVKITRNIKKRGEKEEWLH